MLFFILSLLYQITIKKKELMKMYTEIKGKKLQVKQVGNRFFYFGKAMRWLPISKSKVIFKKCINS